MEIRTTYSSHHYQYYLVWGHIWEPDGYGDRYWGSKWTFCFVFFAKPVLNFITKLSSKQTYIFLKLTSKWGIWNYKTAMNIEHTHDGTAAVNAMYAYKRTHVCTTGGQMSLHPNSYLWHRACPLLLKTN